MSSRRPHLDGDFVVSGDGQRFLVPTTPTPGPAPPITDVVNWTALPGG